MSKEEEDDESNNINLSRFPCMPSLVALQQMRNRLHMAYVGKKLMKWTAQATGRELRKIAFDFTKTCLHFREDMRDSYIRLARARYFCPNLNNMVLEHIANKAEMTIDVKMKSVTGVKLIRLEVVDNQEDAYPHLGIEKGGEAVKDAKYAWKHLLKRIVHMIEHRTSFIHVDDANKAATKKMNVLGKLVIPRTMLSIQYILATLEELSREDFYRMKKIILIKNKIKNTCDHGYIKSECRKCNLMMSILNAKVKESPKKVVLPTVELPKEEKPKEEKPLPEAGESPIIDKPPQQVTTEEDEECVCPPSEISSLIGIEQMDAEIGGDVLRPSLITSISEVIKQASDMQKAGLIAGDEMKEFLLTAKQLQNFLQSGKSRDLKEEKIEENESAKTLTPKEQGFSEPAPSEASEKAVISQKPSVSQEPSVSRKPSVSQEPSVSQKPSVSQEPSVSQKPSISQKPPVRHLDYGTVHIEVQEIVKMVKSRNEDGTIRVERKIYRLKKEVKNLPQSASTSPMTSFENLSSTSDKVSEKFKHSKTIGVVTVIPSFIYQVRNCKSEINKNTEHISRPIVRNCVSLINSTAGGSFISIFMSTRSRSSASVEYKFKHFEYPTERRRIIMNVGVKNRKSLSQSERDLLDTSECHSGYKMTSKSNDEITEKNNKNIVKFNSLSGNIDKTIEHETEH